MHLVLPAARLVRQGPAVRRGSGQPGYRLAEAVVSLKACLEASGSRLADWSSEHLYRGRNLCG